MNVRLANPRPAAAVGLMLLTGAAAQAQTMSAGAPDRIRVAPFASAGGTQPVLDNTIFTHGVLDQFEGRWNGRNLQFRYDGQFWSGTDTNKLWVKSEGFVTNRGTFSDGQHDFLFAHAISPYFDLQGGIRVDLDSGPMRTWAALGVQGLSLYFFNLEATGYVSSRGRFAARLRASYDLLITQRLILQPEAELNLYSKADAARGNGSGLSDIDAGLRLRYEFTRKFAPYVGVAYTGRPFQSADFARRERQPANQVRFIFGVRTWF